MRVSLEVDPTAFVKQVSQIRTQLAGFWGRGWSDGRLRQDGTLRRQEPRSTSGVSKSASSAN